MNYLSLSKQVQTLKQKAQDQLLSGTPVLVSSGSSCLLLHDAEHQVKVTAWVGNKATRDHTFRLNEVHFIFKMNVQVGYLRLKGHIFDINRYNSQPWSMRRLIHIPVVLFLS